MQDLKRNARRKFSMQPSPAKRWRMMGLSETKVRRLARDSGSSKIFPRLWPSLPTSDPQSIGVFKMFASRHVQNGATSGTERSPLVEPHPHNFRARLPTALRSSPTLRTTNSTHQTPPLEQCTQNIMQGSRRKAQNAENVTVPCNQHP